MSGFADDSAEWAFKAFLFFQEYSGTRPSAYIRLDFSYTTGSTSNIKITATEKAFCGMQRLFSIRCTSTKTSTAEKEME